MDRKQLIELYVAQLNIRNYAVLDQLVADEILVGSDKITRDEYKQQIESRVDEYPNYFVKINKMEIKGDIVVLHWHRTGTSKETGEQLDQMLTSEYKISNGIIVGVN